MEFELVYNYDLRYLCEPVSWSDPKDMVFLGKCVISNLFFWVEDSGSIKIGTGSGLSVPRK